MVGQATEYIEKKVGRVTQWWSRSESSIKLPYHAKEKNNKAWASDETMKAQACPVTQNDCHSPYQYLYTSLANKNKNLSSTSMVFLLL